MAAVQDWHLLEEAISDVGVWSSWEHSPGGAFEITLAATQLWSPPETDDLPPDSRLTVRFDRPSFVAFLRHPEAGEEIPADWAQRVRKGLSEYLSFSEHTFTLHDAEIWREVFEEADEVDTMLGVGPPDWDEPERPAALMAFWAGPVGLVVAAAAVHVMHGAEELDDARLADMNSNWWGYWSEYWERRDGDDPLPVDYACEAVAPMR